MSEVRTNVCFACRQEIDLGEGNVVEAVEIVSVPSMSAPSDAVEGLKVVFHEHCFDPNDPNYRRLN